MGSLLAGCVSGLHIMGGVCVQPETYGIKSEQLLSEKAGRAT
jgi:hypothetical protein